MIFQKRSSRRIFQEDLLARISGEEKWCFPTTKNRIRMKIYSNLKLHPFRKPSEGKPSESTLLKIRQWVFAFRFFWILFQRTFSKDHSTKILRQKFSFRFIAKESAIKRFPFYLRFTCLRSLLGPFQFILNGGQFRGNLFFGWRSCKLIAKVNWIKSRKFSLSFHSHSDYDRDKLIENLFIDYHFTEISKFGRIHSVAQVARL